MSVAAGYKATEVGAIPESWEVATLGSLGKFKNGINKPKGAFGSGHPFVNLMDVFGVGKITGSNHLGLIESNVSDQATYDLKTGDVLFIRSSVKPSGVGLTTVVAQDLPRTVYSGFLLRFRDQGQLTTGFKEHCFHDERFRTRIIANSTVSANTNINQSALKALVIGYPPSVAEQAAIAEALSDMDEAIAAVEAVISKKHALKTATMQALLSGKRRLPGFSGEWELKALGQCLKVRHGKSQASVETVNGKYPILATGGEIGRTNNYLHQGPSVLIGRKGTIDRPQYSEGPFWSIDTLFYTEIDASADAKFLFYLFQMIDWRTYNEASGVPSLSSKSIETIEVNMPEFDEQAAIAKTLSDFDFDLTQQGLELTKLRRLKAGMMQQLLTGKIRLV